MLQSSHLTERTSPEIELKLELDPGGATLLRDHVLLRGAQSRSRNQLTVYYDTPLGLLRQHGFSLRVRGSGGTFVQTVKPLTSSAGLMSREEREWPVASIEPDLALLTDTPLGPAVRTNEVTALMPITRSEVQRTSWIVEQGGSRLQVDLDEGGIAAGDHKQDLAEVEFELMDGEPVALLMAARLIAAEVPCRIGVLSKADRGALLAAGAFDRISKAGPVHVDRSMTVAEAFEVMIHACLKHYRLNEPLVLDRRLPRALHQTRVAMRRLRSAFTLFKTAIEDVEFQYLREELRWFTAQLGDARNLDVYLERDLSDAEREALIVRREAAYDQVAAAMNSPRLRMLLLELVGWTAFGAWRSGKPARKPVEGYASSRLDRLWNSIAHIGHHIADLDEHTRHRLRIQVKKMRYAIEFLHELYPDARADEKRFAGAVEELQESLGKLNDLAIARTITAVTDRDAWLIGEPEERVHLREAERAFDDLSDVGPFWCGRHDHHHHHHHHHQDA